MQHRYMLRWTKNEAMDKMCSIYIPLNQSLHWVTWEVIPPKNSVAKKDSGNGAQPSRPVGTITIYDSLHSDKSRYTSRWQIC